MNDFDAIVVGLGHAGVEACLALCKNNKTTLALTLSLDSISFMACNPSIGGTAKGHLVREIDALGGHMACVADECTLQLKMLNTAKGQAVQSLRAQADKNKYHTVMKSVLEKQKNLTIMQDEVVDVLVNCGTVVGVKTALGQTFKAPVVVLTCGVYLNSKVIIGEFSKSSGPNGFQNANSLTSSLLALGLPLLRFKTGTPARVNKNSLDFTKMEAQYGDCDIYPFSFMNDFAKNPNLPCYLTYTNQETHNLILSNLQRSPMYNGSIKGTGPRYCPSIEDKVVRFSDKSRHQIFIEPEGCDTDEMYVQGMSSSLPHDVQLAMYRTISGMENVQITRFAYAIEYDCIDATCLKPTLEVKSIGGLFMAGQINGSSGYEEAGCQGLIAGINATCYLDNKSPLVLSRAEAYIGVLIDDLVTKGTLEPYRMMTARAEHRLFLRQENADIRLSEIGRRYGLIDDLRYAKFKAKLCAIDEAKLVLATAPTMALANDFLLSVGESPASAKLTYADLLKRASVTSSNLLSFFPALSGIGLRIVAHLETEIKYSGYLSKQQAQINHMSKLDNRELCDKIDYMSIDGLRIEAKQKLAKFKPINLGQASRISGVSPADITVLLIYLQKNKLFII